MILTDIFNTAIFNPLYNALIFITAYMPGGDVGLAVVVLTIGVKLVLLPVSHKSIKTQAGIRKINPEIKKIREKHKSNQQEQSKEIMKLYKEHGINPFSGCVLAVIQIPIIFGLYWVFWKGLSQQGLNPDILYNFVPHIDSINFIFLGILDLTATSVVLALLAGGTQYFVMRLSVPPTDEPKQEKKDKKRTFSEELKKGMSMQMRYVLPVVIAGVSLRFPAAIPLYWATSNLFSITHELLVRKKATQLLANPQTP